MQCRSIGRFRLQQIFDLPIGRFLCKSFCQLTDNSIGLSDAYIFQMIGIIVASFVAYMRCDYSNQLLVFV